jgi:hypothetical protein
MQAQLTRVLDLGPVVAEEERSMNVQNSSRSHLARSFSYAVANSNLRTISICGNGCPSSLNLVGHLRRENGPDRAILVKDSHRFAITLDDTSHSGRTGRFLVELHK